MSLWSSFRRFSSFRKNHDAEASRKNLPGGSKARPLKHRDLRLEQFEDRVLLSITTPSLNQTVTYDQPIFGRAERSLPEPGEIQLIALANSPDAYRPIEPLNVNAADTTNADYLQPGGSLGLDLDGTGYTVGVWDAGAVLPTHQEFGGRVAVIDGASSHDHATHVGGTIGAEGVDPSARGMASGVDIRSYDWTADFSEMSADGLLIDVSNHSYGVVAGWRWTVDFSSPTFLMDMWYGDMSVSMEEDAKFSAYTSDAAQLDDLLAQDANKELLSVWAAGNDRNDDYGNLSGDGTYIAYFSADPGVGGWSGAGFYYVNASTFTPPPGDGNSGTGYDSLLSTQTAKNVLTVGAVEDVIVDPYGPGDVQMSTFSGWGPTDDGRIKPDVVGNGVGVYSTVDSSNTAYDTKDGTSMASPNVAGTAVLLKEHFETTLGASPLSSTLKGLIIHTAAEAGNVGPDYTYGWGVVDAKAAAEFVTDVADMTGVSYFSEDVFSGTELTFDIDATGSSPLTATLVWTDLAGAAHSGAVDDHTPALVNDLDIWITDAGGNTYYPWTLDPADPSLPAVRTELNHVDNVEQVKIDVTEAGTYTIHVGGALDASATDQSFSVFVTNEENAVGPELVKIVPNEGGELLAGDTLHVAPRELLFQFNEQQDLDDSTFDAIQITRDAGPIVYQLLPGDKANQVVMRFAETLPDDNYHILIKGDLNDNPLKNVLGTAFNNGANMTIDFELDLGAQVVSVVPQPVYRDGFTLTATDLTGADDGKTFTVSDGFQTVTFELNTDTDPGGYDAANVEFSYIDGTPAVDVAIALQAAIQNEFDADLLTATRVDEVVTVRGSQASVVAGTAPFAVQSIRTLAQATNKIDVYFNDDDLDQVAATNPAFYKLHKLNATTGVSEQILIPDKVVYSAEEDKAQLIFASDLPQATFHLEIGTSGESDDALADATNVGTLWNIESTASFEGYIGDSDAPSTDADLYQFVAGASGTLTVNLTGGFTWDILDSAGASTTTSLTEGLTYYVEVSSAIPGSYRLDLSVNGGLLIQEDNTSYDTAVDLGMLGAASTYIAAQNIGTNDATILSQAGAQDEPGHRHILADVEHVSSYGSYGSVKEYNFGANYGWTTDNQITEAQKDRTREIFEILGYYLGVEFVETPGSGMIIATGDLRAWMPNVPTGAVAGLGGGGGILINAALDWGESEYGGGWFNVAFHEIGHAMGLGHAYDLPAIMGAGGGESGTGGLGVEAIYPEDNDMTHLNLLWNSVWNEIDLYKFETTETGILTAETIAERLATTSLLNTQLVLYREVDVDGTKQREVIAQNDDYFSNDSLIQIELEEGTYYIGVMSTGVTDADPTIEDSGFGGKSTGNYDLKLDFKSLRSSVLVDATGTELDGDADGLPGGTFDFWFRADNTLLVDKETGVAEASGTPNGSPAAPYAQIDEAIAATGPGDIVRVVGNDTDTPYLVGYDNIGYVLEDGDLIQLPRDVTMMIDAGAVFKLQDANIEMGSSSLGIDLSHAALQVLGTPDNAVHFRSFRDDDIGGNSDGSSTGEAGGDWGGLVFRDDSDYEDIGVFLNWVGWSDIQHGGGKVMVGAIEDNYTSIHMIGARPTIAYNTIQHGSGGAISADLASFEETRYGVSAERIGPDVHGNTVLDNTINGLFVRIPTEFGSVVEVLETRARWDDSDIIHVVTENLFIHGTPGGPTSSTARLDGRLRIDPGTVVKLEGARIHAEIAGQLIAEGLPGYPVVFTALKDDTYGMGGNFDTSNDGAAYQAEPGQWGGLIFAPTSHGSLDYVQLSYAGGQTSLGGDFDRFNPIEIHQADVRITNSVIELNDDGNSNTNRGGLGTNTAAAIFIRGAQPVIVNNKIIDNQGDAITIDSNSMKYAVVADAGRETGAADAFTQFGDNRGPLIRLNVLDNTIAGGGNQLNGLTVRGGFLTAESVWDDTDVVHILRDEIVVGNLHHLGGLRLESSQDASLVVKLDGADAGFTANGEALDIEDRIGGTLQILGTPNYPVILTSLNDDTAAAGFNLDGKPQGNTDAVSVNPGAGDWRSVLIDRYANARNVAVVNEAELAYTGPTADNDLPMTAQFLGYLAPDLDPSIDVGSGDEAIQGKTDDEKGGDENLRLGFEVHGTISLDDPTDQDVYSFTATAGSEVWIDLDRTSHALDAKVELIQFNQAVITSSEDEFNITGSTSVVGYAPFAADGLIQENYLGDDFYGTNPLDPGMHVVLPGQPGTTGTYFVRVSSQDIDASGSGDTSGRYEMQVRLRQVDEMPGSTVRYADIRYADNGIEIYGQPAHSILAAEAGETSSDNNSQGGAQNLGNLLESDLNTIGVSGRISSATDVDWYRFEINQEEIQAIGGVNNGAKTFATMFDIDYADGISRANTVLSVYDASGNLILVSYDSNIDDDQRDPAEANNDRDDLSRGSFDTLDPYIGSVHMPSGGPGGTTTYYVAVSSNRMAPTELNQTFQSGASNPDIRLEPVDSVQRIVEDHIGFNGYTSGNSDGSVHRDPVEANGILDIDDASNGIALRSHVVPYTFSDVVLYVASSGGDELHTVNPFTGVEMTDVGDMNPNDGMDDIAMRSDGTLMGQTDGTSHAASGVLRTIDVTVNADASLSGGGNDGLTTDPDGAGPHYQDFAALAFRETGATSWETYAVNNYRYDMDTDPADVNDGQPALWRIDSNGSAHDENGNATGRQPVRNLAAGMGRITGMDFVNNSSTLYLADDAGQLWRTTVYDSGSNRGASAFVLVANLGQTGITGLTFGPQNLDVVNNLDADGDGFPDEAADGIYDLQNVLFASTSNALYAFTTSGTPVIAFDSNGDGVADASSINVSGAGGGIEGLAFSPLDINLWHPTEQRRTDTGHGVNQAFDNSRNTNFAQSYSVPVNGNGNQYTGGVSFYFGLENWIQNPNNNEYERYGTNAQYGFAELDNHRDLASNGEIGNNYNAPGGAHGSLITDTFSLEFYEYADKPTLYYNYFLDTEGEQSDNGTSMYDSARVWVGVPAGTAYNWYLASTNNSELSSSTDWDELPQFLSTSADASYHPRQRVQELFDASDWRQARVDLGEFAGLKDLKLRFDFSTAGRMPTHNTNLESVVENQGNLGHVMRNQDNNHIGFYIDDIIIGFAERGEMVTASNGTVSHSALPTQRLEPYEPVEQLTGEYQLEIRRGSEYAINVDSATRDIAIVEQFDTNARLMPTGGNWEWTWNAGDQEWDQTWGDWPTHHYIGNYIGNYRGDQNVERQQDQLIVENNTIRNVADVGILIDEGNREGLDVPQPGSAINYPVLNGQDLAPGVVVTNNVVAHFGDTGILYSGDSNQGVDPITPFGRIVNNTVVGTNAGVSDYGIRVTQYASPTVLNNIVTTTNRGILIDGTSSSTVANYNLFKDVNINGTNGNFDIDVDVDAPGAQLFVNPTTYNFYLFSGALAIDSSIDVLGDRGAITAVKGPLVIPPSPIIAPERDRYGQLRLDDQNQTPPSGMGANIYKDRGAIERADFAGPTARIVDPLDNQNPRNGFEPKLDGTHDYDPTDHQVVVINKKTTDFAIQLFDTDGIGVDDLTITETDQVTVLSDVVKVYRVTDMSVFDTTPEASWPTLQQDSDYLLDWDPTNNILHVIPAGGVWAPGYYYVLDVNNDLVADLAGNLLQPNRSSGPFTGKTVFSVHLTGLDFGDLPDPNYTTTLDGGPTAGQGGPRHVVTGGIYLGSAPNTELDAWANADATGDYYDDGIEVSWALQMKDLSEVGSGIGTLDIDASTGGYLNAWIDFNGDGQFDEFTERIAVDRWLDPGSNELLVDVPDESMVQGTDPTADIYQRGARFRFTSFAFADVSWLAPQGLGTLSGTVLTDGYSVLAAGATEDHAKTPVIDPTGANNEFQFVAKEPGVGGNDIQITFVHNNGSAAVVAAWDENAGTNGVLTITFDPDDVTLDQLVAAVKAIPASANCPLDIRIDPAAGSEGIAADGEVEDYMLDIVRYRQDWGDAPIDVLSGRFLYPTKAVRDGATHYITGPYLGSRIDAEMDGQPTLNASGDDMDLGDIALSDEDGITFADLLMPGEEASIDVYVSNFGTQAMLDAWIDYNQDGAWDDSEHVWGGTSESLVAGMQTVHFTIPETAVPGGTYARFRLSTNGIATPTGIAADGEVEDYQVEIQRMDFGDADAPYPTYRADDGPRHVIAGPYFGLLADHDVNGQPTPNADGDDEDPGWLVDGDDEDGIAPADPMIPGQDASFQVAVAGTGNVYAWVDLNGDGALHPTDELVISEANYTGTSNLSFHVPYDATPGEILTRFRVVDPAEVAGGWTPLPTGLARSGEVEDNLFTIHEIDYGDALDDYATLRASDGARHVILGPKLGTLVDHDLDGAPTADADGDDLLDANDDEDGVVIPDKLIPGYLAPFEVTVSESAYLDVWVDYNQDKDFDDAGEHPFSQLVNVGDPVHIQIAEDALPGDTYARFRITSDGLGADGLALTPSGLAFDGEVEDYVIHINPVDFGDAPDVAVGGLYPTAPPQGASHMIDGPVLGTLVDHDAKAHQSLDGQGDDSETTDPTSPVDHNGDDEDGIIFLDLSGSAFVGTPTLIPGEQYDLEITVSDTSGVVFGWVDFNGDGIWSDTEKVVDSQLITVTGTPETITVPLSVPANIDPTIDPLEYRFARFRVVSEADAATWVASPEGAVFSGEVEDYEFKIQPVDYGDADKPVTERANDGARHVIDANGPHLGIAVPDWEQDGQRSTDALGDDNDSGGDDEDGIAITDWWGNDVWEVIPGEKASIEVTVNGADGIVYGWADWNRDGDFTDANESFGSAAVNQGTSYTFTPDVPLIDTSIVPGPVDLRFRVSSDGMGADGNPLQSSGLALDGEVEDHQVVLLDVDYGDLPNSVEYDGHSVTERSGNGARHVIGGPYLGLNAPDWDYDGQPNATATGDNENGTDDEDGVAIDYSNNTNVDGSLLAAGQLVPGEWTTLDITVSGTVGETAYVYGWIDFDGNGVWDETGTEDHATGPMPWSEYLGSAEVVIGDPLQIPVFVPRYDAGGAAIEPGEIFARFRVISKAEDDLRAGLTPEGIAYTGEVEDYRFETVGVDYGDAPDNGDSALAPSYSTLWSENGARHILTEPYLGSETDWDADGQPVVTDDADEKDDEDGVSWDTLLMPGEAATITVTASGASNLDAWIDFDGNGIFDAGEQLLGGTIAIPDATPLPISFVVPTDAVPGSTYARFRLSSAGGLSPEGLAQDGEVEDYPIEISGVDYGDAPDSYATLLASNGARHVITGPYLGTVGAPDHDPDGQPDPAGTPPTVAAGDDFGDDGYSGVDSDEDGVTLATDFGNGFSGNYLVPGETATFTVQVGGGVSADVHGWLDVNGNGTWDTGEDFLHRTDVTGEVIVQYNVPQTTVPGPTIARFRVVANSENWLPLPDGVAMSGEVEDHLYTVMAVDYGDANTDPNSTPPTYFPTRRAVDGARHLITPTGPYLGGDVDHDIDGIPSPGVSDDLTDGRDDEDGATFSPLIWVDNPADQKAWVDIDASDDGVVDVWIDLNGNGVWDADPLAMEHVINSYDVSAGVERIEFDVPDMTYAGYAYARVRITSNGVDAAGNDLTPTGLAANGEVEDYRIFLNAVPVAEANGPYWINKNEPLTLDASGSVADDRGVINSPDTIVSYQWDFTGDTEDSFDPEFVTTSAIDVLPWPWYILVDVPEPNSTDPLTIQLRVVDSFGAYSVLDSAELRIFDNEPTAVFDVSSEGVAPDPNGPAPYAPEEPLHFDGTGSEHDRDVDGYSPPLTRQIVKYEWDLDGDGNYETVQNLGDADFGHVYGHKYEQFGQYTAVLRVTDNNVPAKTDIYSMAVNVTEGNVAPVAVPIPAADPYGYYTIDMGDPLTLDGSDSTTGENPNWGDTIVSWQWDLDYNGVTFVADVTGETPEVPWYELDLLGLAPAAGDGYVSHTVALLVEDSFGDTHMDNSAMLYIHENRPHAVATSPATPLHIAPGDAVTFNASNSWHDRDPNFVTDHAWPAADNNAIVSYEWDLHYDGTFDTEDVGAVVSNYQGYSQFGEYSAAVRVTDANGAYDMLQFDIIVDQNEDPPVPMTGGPYTVATGGDILLNASASYDPEDANHENAGDAIVTYKWTVTVPGSTPIEVVTASPFYTLTWDDHLSGLTAGEDYTLTLEVTDMASNVLTADTVAADTVLRVRDDAVTVDLAVTSDPGLEVTRGVDVTFVATAENPYGTLIDNYLWDFDYELGDFEADQSVSGDTVDHAFTNFGTYSVAVIAEDTAGKWAMDVVQITVNGGASNPVADAGHTHTHDVAGDAYYIDIGDNLYLDAGNSSAGGQDADYGDSIQYFWDLDNDGEYDDATGMQPEITSAQLDALGLTDLGQYTIGLKVTDMYSESGGPADAFDTVPLFIFNNQPTAAIVTTPFDTTIGRTTQVKFDGTSSESDRPDRDIVKYEWDFDGDGQFDGPNDVVQDDPGAADFGIVNDVTFPMFQVYNVTLRVTDSNTPGRTDTESILVTVSEGSEAPDAVLSGPALIETGDGITFDGSASTDPDAQYGDAIVGYTWTIDGEELLDFADQPTITIPWNAPVGETSLTGLGLVDPTSVDVTLTVTDKLGKTDVAEATFGIYDNEPLPAFTATPNPVAYDVDVDFDANSSSHSWPTGTITKYEWDFNYDGEPANFDANATGIETDHSYSQFGDYDVALRVTDSNDKMAISVLTIEVSQGNHAPTAVAGGPYVFSSGQTVVLDASASYDDDANHGDSVVEYAWDLDDDGLYDDAFVAMPTMTVDPQDVDKVLPVALRVKDSQGAFGYDTTTVEVVTNVPPTADAGGPYTLTEGTPFQLDGTGSQDDGLIISYEWDLDYDGITFNVDQTGAQPTVTFDDDMASQTIALRVKDAGDKINIDATTLTVVNADPVASIDTLPTGTLEGQGVTITGQADDLGEEDTHTFDWTVTLGGTEVATGNSSDLSFVPLENGDYEVTLTVTDDDGGDHTVTDTLTVLNADPAAGNVTVTPTVTVDGETLIGAAQAVTVTGSFTDPGTLDTHSVSVNWGDGTTADATVNQAAGTYEATHTFAAGGQYTIVATVTDDDNGSHQADATANVVNNLGVVDFRDDLTDQDPTSGHLWFLLTAAHDAFLTVELGGTGASSASVALFDANGNAVNALNNGPSDGDDFLVSAGAGFYLKLSGTAADVDVRLTNLVSVAGSAVSVMGTNLDDAFEFELTNSYLVRINGTQYHFADGPGVPETVNFDGGLGDDTATFTGSAADESARFFTGVGEFYSGSESYDGTGFFVDAAAEHLIAHSEGGRDFIKMYDSPGDDLFTAAPREASLVGPGYSHAGHGFYVGLGYATNREGDDTAGGNDQAILHDSAGNDKFKLDWADAKQFFGKLYGGSYYSRGKNFETIDANATDGNDLAVVLGSPVDDEFFLKQGVGHVTTQRTDVDFLGFDTVVAYAGDGYDIVRFEDSVGDDDFRGRSHKSTMIGPGYDLSARNFEMAYAEAKNGGYDRAKLHDTSLDNILHAEQRSGQSWAQLAVNGTVEDPLYEALAFEFVKAYATEGDDKVDRTEAFDWLFLDGDWTDE